MTADQQTSAGRGIRSHPTPLTHGEHGLEGPSGAPQTMGGHVLGGGTAGNERLTAITGIALILLLAAIGVTILKIRPLIAPHLFIGLMLIPPVALKLTSTGYRFMRYYTSDPIYRKRGAPPMVLRLLAPFVVVSSISVLATGVALMFTGPASSGTLRTLHKVSFIAWIAFTAIHVLGHLTDLQKIFLTKRGGRIEYNELAAGRTGRAISLAGVLIAGIVLAIVLIPDFGAWSHFEAFHHHR